jgi:hypothetical protein
MVRVGTWHGKSRARPFAPGAENQPNPADELI